MIQLTGKAAPYESTVQIIQPTNFRVLEKAEYEAEDSKGNKSSFVGYGQNSPCPLPKNSHTPEPEEFIGTFVEPIPPSPPPPCGQNELTCGTFPASDCLLLRTNGPNVSFMTLNGPGISKIAKFPCGWGLEAQAAMFGPFCNLTRRRPESCGNCRSLWLES